MKLACCILLFAFLFTIVHANTEKTIFVAPKAGTLPALIENLRLQVITPKLSTLQTSLSVAFPSTSKKGLQSWYLLEGLKPRQRHEVRICWAATQPTDFWLDVFEPDIVLKDRQLIDEVTRSSHGGTVEERQQATKDDPDSAVLLLRIVAAADFFTTNRTLMRDPPPVHVDIILDPYLGNIFPRSLIPTAIYIVALAVIGWYASGKVWAILDPVETKSHPD